ncbi:MAG: aldolase [Candidatus Methanoliparum thermophilum]|uniref:Aldolase n=1 Tax=Methanoliparum thermophilum TaxID=2491083 RepID=A0A520KRM3_METT2|nr:aldolase [Candidatus Methanoliparum sp. LAM-1]RZN64436.1 MAG: aldolase [Candidatus Methanoliparum thermophilum]BDC35977.1 fructose-bisphosphate aldolase [Candidatus Methanoliparum sp. LAM-1]
MDELIKYGKKIVANGLVHSHFGNVSRRIGDYLLISSTGSMLDELEGKIVKVSIYKESSLDSIASSELPVHREIYKNTSASAILHGHSVFAVVESMLNDEYIVSDSCETEYFLSEIPIIKGGVGSKELAKNAAKFLKDHLGVIIKGHGTIGTGSNVKEAYFVLSSIEHICKIKYYLDIAKNRKDIPIL